MTTFNLYINGGFPAIVEIDEDNHAHKNVPFGIMVKDQKFSDDMRWFVVTPDTTGSKRDVYNALQNNELIQYCINPQAQCPGTITRAQIVTCHVYYLDGSTKSFDV